MALKPWNDKGLHAHVMPRLRPFPAHAAHGPSLTLRTNRPHGAPHGAHWFSHEDSLTITVEELVVILIFRILPRKHVSLQSDVH